MSLAARLLSLVALAVSPALTVVAFNEFNLRRSKESETRQFVAETSARASAEVRHIVENVNRVSAIVAKLPEVKLATDGTGFFEACSELLTSLRQDSPGQLEFGIANRDGLIVCTTQGARTVRPVEGAHFKQALETNRFVVGTFGVSRTTGARYLTFAQPIRGEAGQAVGAVLTGVDLDWLSERMRPFLGPGHAVLSVHDRNITFLARVPNEAGLVGKKPPPDVMAASRFIDRGPIEAKGADGATRIGAIRSVTLSEGAPDLYVAYGLSRDAVFVETNAATLRGLMLLLASAALAAGAAWYGGRRFIREPIERLLAAAERWKVGDYTARVSLTSASSEFGRLARAYEEMADALASREQHQRLLINELNHRVKNTLATVQSIAGQAFKSGEHPDVRGTFEARLFALAKTHDMLTRENWEGAELTHLVAEAFAPYRREGGARFEVEGPDLWVKPSMALALSMAFHELATNAAKYGALSVPSGRIVVCWSITGGAVRQLTLRWQEKNGPRVSPPRTRGFGSRLIERSLAAELGGEVHLTYDPGGVVCTLKAPLDETDVALRSTATA
jgi:two-component sensor histidine kinase